MKKISLNDILPLDEYQRRRDEIRRRIIAVKKERRIEVGPRVSFVFENSDTVLFQIQEMIRAEHMIAPQKIQEEIDVYNSLIPEPRELSATMFIEIEDQGRIKKELEAFVGIDAAVSLSIGDESVPGVFESGRTRDNAVSAVQYVRFRLTPEQIGALKGGGRAALVISHPRYSFSHDLPLALTKTLSEELI